MAVGIPSSVLPDISPSRVEIGWRALPASSHASLASAFMTGRDGRSGSFSPLEGEMSAKLTEGDATSRIGRHDAH
ncbi:hypothetical protein ASE36_05215 [Rhizobium sp. Root274]|nr:hypothetical protein ASC71_05220 [Rhizobium sp. Root1240]KRD33176.1 hypothetical protein ASE36_05215 [Rhizobium sp. Root274]